MPSEHPILFTPENVTIECLTGAGPVQVTGRQVGPLFVHRMLGEKDQYWSITHIGTGRCVMPHLASEALAVRIAADLAKLEGWDKDMKALTRSRTLQMECMQILRQHGINVVRGCY